MKKIYFLIAGSMCFMLTGYSQKTSNYIEGDYYASMYKADSLFIVNRPRESYEILDNLFKKFKPINLKIYYELKTYTKAAFLINQEKKSFKALKSLIEDHGLTWNQIKNDSILKVISLKMKMDSVNHKCLYEKFTSKLNLELRSEILKMKKADQLYRKNRNKFQKNIHKQDSIDEVNTKRLIQIFEQYGYPNHTLVGSYDLKTNSNPDIRALLLHTKDSIRLNYFLPKILEYIKKGKCDPIVYASIYDQYLLYNNKKSRYGSITTKEPELTFKTTINSNRQEVGLPKYGYEAWRRNILYGGHFNRK